ncbi:MAG TPA: hypothetical protein PLS29_05965 [Acidimicrobiales bacterium]|nr:MAG: hypothetical protein B7Z69_05035 [Actinobacteria bacterium 21-73-9]HQU26561.1 hypothetical protein [Acidimicrobiales bacterium]
MGGPLRLGTFTPSVLLEVARTSGALERAGLEVDEVPVASSPAQFQSLLAGELDAVLTSPDNVLAYHFLSRNPLGRRIPLAVEAAIDRGLGLSLWARAGVETPHPGATLAVDVAASGFAFVGYALLARRGLTRDDVEVVALGSTPRRAAALVEGRCDLTVLNAGNQYRARAAGASLLGEASDLGPYLGTVLAGLATTSSERRRLADALVEVAGEIVRGRLGDAVREAATTRLGLSALDAAEFVGLLRDPERGLAPTGAVDRRSVRTLVDLRHAAEPDRALGDVESGLEDLVAAGHLTD